MSASKLADRPVSELLLDTSSRDVGHDEAKKFPGHLAHSHMKQKENMMIHLNMTTGSAERTRSVRWRSRIRATNATSLLAAQGNKQRSEDEETPEEKPHEEKGPDKRRRKSPTKGRGRKKEAPRSDDVDEASKDSFPASDPPAY